ncbi:MAG: cytochrome c [Nitrospirae bacterium]|nr:cytochrome c [Nitrospirota bacterium]
MVSSIVIMAVAVSFNLSFAGTSPSLPDAEKTYSWYCAPCHGVKGDGNGFNAKNLDPRPANHTDPNLMTKRTDEELFGVISGGGKGVGKSTLMPPWGNTFDKARIESLVKYLRELCRCQEE